MNGANVRETIADSSELHVADGHGVGAYPASAFERRKVERPHIANGSQQIRVPMLVVLDISLAVLSYR